MNEKRVRKGIIILNVVLFLGLFVYALILFIINKKLNPASYLNTELWELRFFWRRIAEKTSNFFCDVYIIGNIIMAYELLKNRYIFSLSIIAKYYLLETIIMFAIVLPFTFFDIKSWGDYFFPIWSLLIRLLLICINYLLISLFRQQDGKKGKM